MTGKDKGYIERERYIEALGGSSEIALRLGASSHRTVNNWKRYGFPAWAHDRLLRMGRQLGIPEEEIPTELLTEKLMWTKRVRPPTSRFIMELVKTYGGVREMSRETGIPADSIKFMRRPARWIMPKWRSKLEECAEEKGVGLPKDWWS